MHIAEQQQTVSPVNGVKSSMIVSRKLPAEVVIGRVLLDTVKHGKRKSRLGTGGRGLCRLLCRCRFQSPFDLLNFGY